MKRPPWLLVSPGQIRDGAVLALDQAEARHALGALRLATGDEVVVADGEGRTASARLRQVGKSGVETEILSCDVAPRPAADGVTLALAVIDPKAMDWAVQKSVEIGIQRLQPVVTDRTQSRGRTRADRSAHWERVALQALKQCRRPWAMELSDPQPLTDFVARQISPGVVADPEGLTIGSPELPRANVVVVGPEGGFSPPELKMFRDCRWSRLRLGDYVLRTETAAIVAGALLIAHNEIRGAG